MTAFSSCWMYNGTLFRFDTFNRVFLVALMVCMHFVEFGIENVAKPSWKAKVRASKDVATFRKAEESVYRGRSANNNKWPLAFLWSSSSSSSYGKLVLGPPGWKVPFGAKLRPFLRLFRKASDRATDRSRRRERTTVVCGHPNRLRRSDGFESERERIKRRIELASNPLIKQ